MYRRHMTLQYHERPRRMGVCPVLMAWALCCGIPAASVAEEVSVLTGFEPVGTRIVIHKDMLPEPYDEPSVANIAAPATRKEGHLLQVKEGFSVNIFAQGLEDPRRLLVDETGGVYLAQSSEGTIHYLQDDDGDGVAETIHLCADGFRVPYGMALSHGAFYVADVDHVWRLAGDVCDGGRTEGEEQRIPVTPDSALGSASGHSTRNIALSRDGRELYVAVGSRGNIGIEPEPRATIRRFDLKTGAYESYATGLRNPVGLVMREHDRTLWTVVNERDGLGDRLVPDYMAKVEQGDFFGWPYSYLGDIPQPDWFEKRPKGIKAKVPEMLFHAHSAPLGFAFYDDASLFPQEYHGGAFVALHGSWNARVPQGYMVAFVPFADGIPQGSYEVFASGFRVDTPPSSSSPLGDDPDAYDTPLWQSALSRITGYKSPYVIGRPADVAVARDGSLLIADDVAGVIWRITYGEE
ncbi:MAG: PQQ-dependent sugar dehydrogenase [Alphaproteobacteria bacterium GM7ARS4]|nr:PQQ-dependent sugar dehydrogenase [Alphaproteobacteria bacterium GM7ARS4]